MFKVALLVIILGGTDKGYDATARYNDSVLIYTTYHSQIETLRKLKETDRQKWYDLDALSDKITTCAKLRLKKFNHEDYEPIMVFERPGMGTAYAFPKPGSTIYVESETFPKTETPKYHFVVYDKQTHFLKEGNCFMSIPYILKLVFDKGRLLFTDKLNPVTMEKL